MMNFRDLVNKLDNIEHGVLSEALSLSAVIAATSGYEQNDKVRIPMLADLAGKNGLMGLVDPVTGHYISKEGDEEDEVPFEIAQQLSKAGLLPKNARMQQAGWFDNEEIFNAGNKDLIDQSSKISGSADELTADLAKLKELFDKYLQLKSKRASQSVAASSLTGPNPADAAKNAITPDSLKNIQESFISKELIESFGYGRQ